MRWARALTTQIRGEEGNAVGQGVNEVGIDEKVYVGEASNDVPLKILVLQQKVNHILGACEHNTDTLRGQV